MMSEERNIRDCAVRPVFTEEVINSFVKTGEIASSYGREEVIMLVGESLAKQNRFNGMCRVEWSVLMHSFLVSCLVHDKMLVEIPESGGEIATATLMGLLHDVGEAIVGDMVFPLKNGVFRKAYDESYLPLETAFREWFGTEVLGIADFRLMWKTHEKAVLEADRMAGEMELFALSMLGDFHLGEILNASGVVDCIGELASSCTARAFANRIRELAEEKSFLEQEK